MTPQRFRKRPVVIEAVQLTRANLLDVANWCGGQARTSGRVLIPTLEGEMQADLGDWIIRGVADEFYPCKPDIFAATYEPEEPTP